jgi:hypothetical protein
MTSTELTEKFKRLESKIAAEKGDLALFALFLREDVPDRWDLIVSAPWASRDEKSALDYLITTIKSDLSPQDLTNLSRIVFIDPQDASVLALNKAVHVEHEVVEIRDSNFFGLPIKHAFIITSKRVDTAVPK